MNEPFLCYAPHSLPDGSLVSCQRGLGHDGIHLHWGERGVIRWYRNGQTIMADLPVGSPERLQINVYGSAPVPATGGLQW